MGMLRYRMETKIIVTLRKRIMNWRSAFVNAQSAVSHVTVYAAGNAGDTALSECVRRTFNIGLGLFPWKLISVVQKVDAASIERLNHTQAIVIGGGGLFLPDTNPNTISGWQWAVSEDQLDCIRVPVILYSVGYNYFRGQIPSSSFIEGLNAIVDKSLFVGLRNHGSMREVKALLRTDLKEKVVYQPCTTTVLRFLLPELPPKTESRKVAFNLAFDRMDRRYGENKEKILHEIIKSIYAIRDKGYKVYVIAHCPLDLTVMRYINNRSGIRAVNASWWDAQRLAGFYNSIDVVIGMRGHAQMIPFGVNCQIITLGSHEKMKWFLEDIDAMDWYIELTENVDSLSERIVAKFTEIHEKKGEETNMRLLKAQKHNWEITCTNMEKIKQLIANYAGGK